MLGKNSGLFLIVLYSLIACTIGQDSITVVQNSPSYTNVDVDLWIYFSRFEEEANQRGIDVDLRRLDISGEINSIDEEGVIGTCHYQSHTPNHVTIDFDFWERASTLYREYVVFHELGHCVLLRDHNDAHDSNGVCVSVMHSGLTDCRTIYNQEFRESYLDELFSALGD